MGKVMLSGGILRVLVIAMVLSAACVVLTGCTTKSEAQSEAGSAAVRGEERVRFASGGQELEGVVDTPAPGMSNGWGVVLIGGGLGNDLNWSVPGLVAVNGAWVQMTINREAHADAPPLARALADEGFTVLRWSTIAVDDPLRDQWPVRATPRSLGELMQQSRDAIATLRRVDGVRGDQIIVIGHSLGAARACTLAAEDPGIRALILLSPAYFTHDSKPPMRFAEAKMRLGEDVVRERGLACLAVFGALDTSKPVNEVSVRALVGTKGFEDFEVRTFDGLGHALGKQEGARVGPIAPEVVGLVAEWARSVTRGR